jgi:predicted RNA-binding protein associated with RNAse of E/G family
MTLVKIHYRRPPDRVSIYENELVHAADNVTVTIMRATRLPRDATANGDVILQNGAPIVWFTFPHADHDIGRFHTRNGVFTGLYANILTPVEFISDREWSTTDLFLDLWIGKNDRQAQILDEDELADALARGWIDAPTAASARATAERLVQEYQRGTWPPAVVYDWPLERILEMEP